MTKLTATVDEKISIKEMRERLEEKVDLSRFQRAFPPDQAPLDFLKGLIKTQTDTVTENIFNVVQGWDNKLVTLRRDIDVKGLYKRVANLAEKYLVDDQFD